MAVMILNIDRPDWNHLSVVVLLHGVDMEPTAPTGDLTTVEITGTVEKLQQVLKAAGRGPTFVKLEQVRPINTEV